MSEVPKPKKLPAESHAREAGLAAAEATAELLESGGYSFRHFDLGLVWPRGQGLVRAPMLLAVLAPLGAVILAPVMPMTQGGYRLLMASNVVLPALLGVVGALTLVRVRDRLAGQPASPGRNLLGLAGAAALLQVVFLPASMAMHAAVFRVFGVALAVPINLVVGLVVTWAWTHVLARLALLGEGLVRALALGIADAVIYGLRALAELPLYPGLWWARLRGEEDLRISAVDLLASQLIIRGLGAVGASLVTVAAVMFGVNWASLEPGLPLFLYLAGQAFTGALALQLGLGRWAFYRLALAAETGPESLEAAPALPPARAEATS
jgi:hypothetical protein